MKLFIPLFISSWWNKLSWAGNSTIKYSLVLKLYLDIFNNIKSFTNIFFLKLKWWCWVSGIFVSLNHRLLISPFCCQNAIVFFLLSLFIHKWVLIRRRPQHKASSFFVSYSRRNPLPTLTFLPILCILKSQHW